MKAFRGGENINPNISFRQPRKIFCGKAFPARPNEMPNIIFRLTLNVDLKIEFGMWLNIILNVLANMVFRVPLNNMLQKI